MRVLGLPKLHPHNPVKPGFWLGFFFWLAVIAGLIVLFGEYHVLITKTGTNSRWFGLDGGQWLAFLGGWTALLGALTSAQISLRNSIKQHTLNVLLDMRLSETYMMRAAKLTTRYYALDGIYYITDDEIKSRPPEACLPEVIYVLNYLEFIASAIRKGDLDENLLRESLRGILCNNFESAYFLILSYRRSGHTTPNNKLYEHLEWLYHRWMIPALKRPLLTRI